MKLLCAFVDQSGTSLASPITVEHPDEDLAYANARAFRKALCEKRGVRVYLETREVG